MRVWMVNGHGLLRTSEFVPRENGQATSGRPGIPLILGGAMSDTDPKAIATRCLASWSKRDLATTRSLLDDSAPFVGPLAATERADAYIEGAKRPAQTVEEIDQHEVCREGEDVSG